MVTLRPKKVEPKEYANQAVQFPVAGDISFDENGCIEVDDELSEKLIAATKSSFDFEIVVPEKKKKERIKVESDIPLDEEEEEESEEEQPSDVDIRKELNAMTADQLLAFAKENGITIPKNSTDSKIKNLVF